MSIVVTGGAGYIGSHVVRALRRAGLSTVVVDDLSSGHREFVSSDVDFVESSILETTRLQKAFSEYEVDAVIHLAGFKYAGVSVERPLHTYEQNVQGTVSLLAAMHAANVQTIVFSSSAATYGTPDTTLVNEQTPTHPESPYGESKLIGEWLMRDAGAAWGLGHTSLRYFNVVGSATSDLYDTSPHNLFPLVMDALVAGRTPRIFGDDYPTDDGTCVRDYVHVADLADAHVVAVEKLLAGEYLHPVYNLGSGTGASVREIMAATARATTITFEPEVHPRRPGDPARIVADGTLAAADLGWQMRHSLDDMVTSAWQARQAHT